MPSPLEFSAIGTLDELLERAQRGAQAGQALDTIKEELTTLRNATYYKLLNATDPKLQAELIAELKAVEKLAKVLLVREAQGDLAYQQLMAMGRETPPEPSTEPLTIPKVSRKRSARSKRAAS